MLSNCPNGLESPILTRRMCGFPKETREHEAKSNGEGTNAIDITTRSISPSLLSGLRALRRTVPSILLRSRSKTTRVPTMANSTRFLPPFNDGTLEIDRLHPIRHTGPNVHLTPPSDSALDTFRPAPPRCPTHTSFTTPSHHPFLNPIFLVYQSWIHLYPLWKSTVSIFPMQ